MTILANTAADATTSGRTLQAHLPDPGPEFEAVDIAAEAASHPRRLRQVLVASDIAAVMLAWAVVLLYAGELTRAPLTSLAIVATAGILTALLASHWGLYLARVNAVRTTELTTIVRIAFAVALAGLVADRVLTQQVPWFGTVFAGLLCFLLLAATRSIFDAWIKARRRAGDYCRRVLLVGRDEAAAELLDLVGDQPELGYRVVGFVGPRDEPSEDFDVEWVGDYCALEDAVAVQEANGVIVASSALRDAGVREAVVRLVDEGVHVQVSAGLPGVDRRRLRASSVGYEPVIYLERQTSEPWRRHVKRAIDLVLASIVMVLAMPLLLLSALAIKIHDRGPVLFRQERVGRNGRHFWLLKLRTMEIDAESKLAELNDRSERTGPLFKLEDDPRVTAIGRILRATSFDEIPQLFNVLRGEMSLVGPRPALPSEVEQFDTELRGRDQLPPGITGLWQLEARDNPSFRVYRRLDLFYLRNWSMTLDFVILVSTAYAVLIRATSALTRLLTGRRRSKMLVNDALAPGNTRPLRPS